MNTRNRIYSNLGRLSLENRCRRRDYCVGDFFFSLCHSPCVSSSHFHFLAERNFGNFPIRCLNTQQHRFDTLLALTGMKLFLFHPIRIDYYLIRCWTASHSHWSIHSCVRRKLEHYTIQNTHLRHNAIAEALLFKFNAQKFVFFSSLSLVAIYSKLVTFTHTQSGPLLNWMTIDD